MTEDIELEMVSRGLLYQPVDRYEECARWRSCRFFRVEIGGPRYKGLNLFIN